MSPDQASGKQTPEDWEMIDTSGMNEEKRAALEMTEQARDQAPLVPPVTDRQVGAVVALAQIQGLAFFLGQHQGGGEIPGTPLHRIAHPLRQ